MYLNGTEVTSAGLTGDNFTLNSEGGETDNATIGNVPAGGRDFDGQMQEARVSDVARSADWICTDYKTQNDPSSFYSVGPEEGQHYWTGNTDSDWATTSNWGACQIPASGESIIIPNTGTNPVLDMARTINDLLIETGASVDINSNILTVNASIKNDGTFNQTTGTVIFGGSSEQRITGTVSSTFNNLTISNTSGSVKGSISFTVNGTLNFTSGHLVLTDATATIGNSGSITNADNTRYVVTANGTGCLTQNNLGAGGRTGAILFPVGTSTTSYTPLTIDNTTGTADSYCVRVCDNVFNEGTCGSGTQITSETVDRTWFVTEGVATGSIVTLTLQWNGVDELTSFDRSNMTISRHTGAVWQFLEGGITAAGGDPYTASTSGVNMFSPFGAGSGGSPLPIELISFDAQVVENKVLLIWETAFEKDNHFFTIERFRDGQNFEIVTTLEAVGNSQVNQSYSLFDEQPYEGLSYYRLKQTDFDGAFTYSHLESVQINRNTPPGIIIFPNPANGNEFTIRSEGFVFDSGTTIQIMDIHGKTLYRFQPELPEEKYQPEITIKSVKLPLGIYIVSVYSLTNIAIQRLIILE